MINCCLEWMVVSVLIKVKIMVVGEGFEMVEIDFGCLSFLMIMLSGLDKWFLFVVVGVINIQLLDDIEDWQMLMLKELGVVVMDLVFIIFFWKVFWLDIIIKDNVIMFLVLSLFGNQVDVGLCVNKGVVYKGCWGNFDLWLYNDWFIDFVDGIEKLMIFNGVVLMLGVDLMGICVFGVILDFVFNYGFLVFVFKLWVMFDFV